MSFLKEIYSMTEEDFYSKIRKERKSISRKESKLLYKEGKELYKIFYQDNK